MSEENRLTPHPLRIDPELRAELEAAAKNAGRSLQSEISRRLYASLRPTPESVSYTHLDVYKRQIQVIALALLAANCPA